jgi:hypothetical protein
LPGVRELEGEEARAACESLLGDLHSARLELLPTPVPLLDQTVQDWVHAAEKLAFECPGARGHEESLLAAIEKLELLAAEIDAALVMQQGHATPRDSE